MVGAVSLIRLNSGAARRTNTQQEACLFHAVAVCSEAISTGGDPDLLHGRTT